MSSLNELDMLGNKKKEIISKSDLKKRIKELEEKNIKLKEDSDSSKQEIDKLSKLNENLKNENQNIKEEMNELKNKNNNNNQDLIGNIKEMFYVDIEECIAYDACIEEAKDFFAMSNEGYAYVKVQPTSSYDLENCNNAMDSCPVGAISMDY